jgi:hypothetical protein
MANVLSVLSEEKREQVVALGRLGWSLRRIEQSTGVRRETAALTSDSLASPYVPEVGRQNRPIWGSPTRWQIQNRPAKGSPTFLAASATR